MSSATLLGLALLLVWFAAIGLFLYWADVDARSWVTPYERLAHPYSRRTQIMLIPVLLGWVLPVCMLG